MTRIPLEERGAGLRVGKEDHNRDETEPASLPDSPLSQRRRRRGSEGPA